MLHAASAIRVALRRSAPALACSACRPAFFSSTSRSPLSFSASRPPLPLLLRSLGPAASRPPRGSAAFTAGRQLLQRAADASPLSSSGSSASSLPSSPQSSPSSPLGRWDRWGGENETLDERQLRYLRHLYLLSFLILTLALLNWWNSSVAAGGALLTAHETKELFERLMALLQREDAMLRSELGVLSEVSKRAREDVRNELQDIRREIVSVLLNAREGRRGGAAGWDRGEQGWGGDYWRGDGRGIRERLGSAVSGGGDREQREQRERGEGGESWLSSLAEKASEKAREAAEKAGQLTSKWRGDDQSAWEQGFAYAQQQQQAEAARAASRAQPGSDRFKGGGTVPTSQVDAAYQTGKSASDKPQQ